MLGNPWFSRTGFPWSLVTTLALAAAIGYLAWAGACTIGAPETVWDDNYMTYVYSRNLAQGHGLRFNPTDASPTEGFSSLSHVLLVTLGDKLGMDPLVASRGLSLFIFLLIPLVIGVPLARLLETPRSPVLACAYGAQLTYFLSSSTMSNLQLGMETILFMGSVAYLAGWSLAEFRDGSPAGRFWSWHVLWGCLATALVIISRPEGPVLVFFTLAVVHLARRFLFPELRDQGNRSLFVVAAVSAIWLLLYFAWKKAYFGYLLPNPYYVKAHNAILGTGTTLLPGLPQTKEFLSLVFPWLIAGIPLFFLARKARTARRALMVAALPGACMVIAYSRAIHEAAFWYRYEFPFLVYLHLLLTGLVCIAARKFRMAPALLVPFALVWVHLASVRQAAIPRDPTAWLRVRLGENNAALTWIGKDLSLTNLGQRATIALSASGAIPYFSGFRAKDLTGLNDNYLSGREPHTIKEAWDYIDRSKPDVIQSGLPPASRGIGMTGFDPALGSPAVRAVLSGSGLAAYADPGRIMEMVRREMNLLRDHYTFGAAYTFGGDWVILYLRRDSPYQAQIRSALVQGSSPYFDQETDLRPYFFNDPRQL
jgi:hypothetical protein